MATDLELNRPGMDSPSDPRARIVGLDFGTKRVGLALADPLRMFARPAGTFTPKAAIERLKSIDAEEGIACLVVGWPLTPDGREAEATTRVQAYIDRIRRALPHLHIEKVDERFSSRRAGRMLVQAGVRKKARREKARIDAAAAALILQDYLDEHAPDRSPP